MNNLCNLNTKLLKAESTVEWQSIIVVAALD
jgi:hypothetical protein